MKKVLFFALMAILSTKASADDSGTCGENLTWTYEEATQTLTISGTGEMNNYTYSYGGNTPWENYKADIQNIVVNEGVSYISDYSFDKCISASSVRLPSTLLSIGIRAFRDCDNLKVIDIPNGVKEIKEAAFRQCDILESIEIPQSVISIGDGICYGCRELKSVNILAQLTEIPNRAFRACWSLESITIPESVVSIGDFAFWGSSIGSITIPESVVSIGDNAFEECGALESITIPESIDRIGAFAFSGCTNLTIDYLSFDIRFIGESAFSGCTIKNLGLTSDDVHYGALNGSLIEKATLSEKVLNKIMDSDYMKKQIEEIKNIPEFIIEEGAKIIPHGAFSGFSLNKITLPSSIEIIGHEAFRECPNLEAIEIPEKVTYIGNETFFRCSKLSKIKFPDSLESIGNNAFSQCKNLQSIDIPKSVWIIGENAFFGCISLSKIFIPSGVTEISGNPFEYCLNLEVIEVDKDNKVFDSRNNCNAIIETETNKLITGCSKTIIPEGIVVIGANAFKGCSNLKTITIVKDVKEIGSQAFAHITPNEIITRAESIKLKVICYPEIVPETAADAFLYTDLASSKLLVPESSVELYKSALPWRSFSFIEGMNATAISNVGIDDGGAMIFDLNGNRVDKAKHGVNIIRERDGKTRKMVFK